VRCSSPQCGATLWLVAAVAIVRVGEPPTFECEGFADRPSARPIDPDTVFRIASISKTMTAIGVMQLREPRSRRSRCARNDT